MIEIRKYRGAQGWIPFDDWIKGLRDRRARMRVKVRIDRLSLALEGDWKPVGEGVRELRVPDHEGYRIYYGWDNETVVILLCGGNQHNQQKDIEAAKSFWRDYCDGE